MTREIEDIRAYFLRVRAMAEEGLAKCDAILPASPSSETRVVKYMTIAQYAEHRNASVGSVRNWIRLGLPHSRRGSVIRIPVTDADGWEERGAIARSAERAAGGQR